MSQLSYARGAQDKPLLTKTIGDAFDEAVTKYANREALISRHQNIRLTWRELSHLVDKSARGLMALGMKPGERLAIFAPNCSQWLITQFAAAKAGIILVNINPAYRLNELEYALKKSGSCWLITESSFKTSDYHMLLNQLIPELKGSEPGKLDSAILPDLKGIISLSDDPAPGMMAWQQIFTLSESVSEEALVELGKTLQFDDPINIQFTSGTTGFPKGATLSHYNILNNGYMVGESLGYTENDRIVIPVPLFHCFGMVMGNLAAVTHGSTMIYPDASFDAGKSLQAAAEEKATALYGVPTMFIAMLTHESLPDLDLSNLRTGIMAGTTCPIEVMKHVITHLHMAEVQICYGMTETSPVSVQTSATDNLDRRVTTVGRTQPHLETKIINKRGQIVPRGEIGVLCTRGYSVMLGYWAEPVETHKVIDDARWMRTGDLAIMDNEGYVQIVGRNSDMIIRGGENIYPREIEEFFFSHPAIADVQVIGVPSEKFGEEVEAWIILLPGKTATEEELQEYCKEKIAHFKIPRYIRLVTEFPMTSSGKVQKFVMREMSMRERGVKKVIA